MKKRKGLAAAVCLILLLTACGQGAGSGPASAGTKSEPAAGQTSAAAASVQDSSVVSEDDADLVSDSGSTAADSASSGSASSGSGASAETGWTLEGYFQDENNNFLSITPSEEEDYPGWYVGCYLGEDMYGWYIGEQPDGTLHGNLVPEGEEGEFIVTISREGEDSVLMTAQDGTAYHFFTVEMADAAIMVYINTDGMGNIEYVEGEVPPEIDEEYPFQSAQINLAEPAVYTFAAWAEDGWKFVKWTKDGEDYSTDAQITQELTESAEYVAIFDPEDGGESSLDAWSGSFDAGRAHAEAGAIDAETLFITIDWGDSADTSYIWNIAGHLDSETLTMTYEGCSMTKIVSSGDGGEETEETEYEDGTGTIVFEKDGSGFTWQDDMSDREDVVFRRSDEN